MKRHCRYGFFGAFLFVFAVLVQAAPQRADAYAVVDSVQMPAWVERQGVRQPLAPGQTLQNRDRILTGSDARVLIQLAEGSAVKLGENAELNLNALGYRENRVFTAALDVAQGAFRFTTGVFSRLRQQRAVNVRIATIAAGIRGTDLWGKADGERDLVCLLEGRITVMHAQDEVREMDEPLSFYVAPRGSAPNPVGKVDPAQLSVWALQTEILDGTAYSQRGGKWKLELASHDSEADALALYDRARAAGYAVSIKPADGQAGAYRYSVRLTQLPTQAAAEMLASRLKQTLALSAPVVSR